MSSVWASVSGSMQWGWILQTPLRVAPWPFSVSVPICDKLAHIQTRATASDRAVSLGWRGWANSGTVLEME